HGYPLWIPDPDEILPQSYCKDGISIGDVGLLTQDEGFDFLFNVHTSANNAVNSGAGVPWDDLLLATLNDPNPIRKTSFMHKEKSSITSANLYSSASAVLMLPGGAHRYKAKNISVYENYASKDGLAWYQYANVTLGQGAPNGLLYRVTGCNKCRSWEMAAVSQPDETQEVSLKFVA
ncbi:hypothetical protein CPB85DRAFT_1166399, partial [Mucidula mucida]